MSLKKASGGQIFEALWRTQRVVSDYAQAEAADLDLGGTTEVSVLETLLQMGPQPVNALGKRVMLTSGSITAAVDRLANRGWVERRASPADRRVVEVHLTTAGRRVARESGKRFERALELVAGDLGAAERAQLLLSLRKLSGRVEALSAGNRIPFTREAVGA